MAGQLVHLPTLLALDSLAGCGVVLSHSVNLALLIRSDHTHLIHFFLVVCPGRHRVADSVVPPKSNSGDQDHAENNTF